MSKKIQLTQDRYAIVDDEDFEYLNQWKWYANKMSGKYYAARNENRKTVLMHRFLLSEDALNKKIDHRDGDTLNNCRGNLRICSHSENMRNRISISKNNTSGFKGVCWNKKSSKWHAQIRFETKKINIGFFDCKIQAAKAYNAAALKYHGEFANLNQIPE